MNSSARSGRSFGISISEIEEQVAGYFGVCSGGINLRCALQDLPLGPLSRLADAVAEVRAQRGRVFLFGNGGSYDNARAIAVLLREYGVEAKTPGHEDEYARVTRDRGYEQIFVEALERDAVSVRDVVVGISGSGNSANVVSALRAAQQRGARAFCLGGRDGGAMRRVCGDDCSVVVRNQCMEAIEDLHMFAAVWLGRQLSQPRQPEVVLRSVVSDFDRVISQASMPQLVRIAQGVLGTVERGSRVLVLGMSIGANHVMADWERGATNRLPIRGVSAPMIYSQNAAMATLNDDGHFALAHGLIKREPNENDFAVVFDLLTPSREISAVREIVRHASTPSVQVGGSGEIPVSGFERAEQDLIPAMVGHFVSASLREVLGRRFEVRPRADVQLAFPAGDKKLGREETEALESRLRTEGRLERDRVIVFNYGEVFDAADPAKYGIARVFY